jgi:hypothetical protein
MGNTRPTHVLCNKSLFICNENSYYDYFVIKLQGVDMKFIVGVFFCVVLCQDSNGARDIVVWTEDEVARLIDAVEQDQQEQPNLVQRSVLKPRQRTHRWVRIAEIVETKTARQCKSKWRPLAPSEPEIPWREEEKALLRAKVEKHGERWDLIACFFEGRSVVKIKDQWNMMSKVAQADTAQLTTTPPPPVVPPTSPLMIPFGDPSIYREWLKTVD